jgi:hypothetical protein
MLRRLLNTLFGRTSSPKTPPPTAATAADYASDRETDRVGHLSPEDRAWETASRRRSDDNEAAHKSS